MLLLIPQRQKGVSLDVSETLLFHIYYYFLIYSIYYVYVSRNLHIIIGVKVKLTPDLSILFWWALKSKLSLVLIMTKKLQRWSQCLSPIEKCNICTLYSGFPNWQLRKLLMAILYISIEPLHLLIIRKEVFTGLLL